MKSSTLGKLLTALIILSSCATTGGKIYLPPVPRQEEISEEEVIKLKNTNLYKNYMKLSEWVETVWEANQ